MCLSDTTKLWNNLEYDSVEHFSIVTDGVSHELFNMGLLNYLQQLIAV